MNFLKASTFALCLASLAMFFLSGCAHERTEIDRELVLKLADRPQVQVIQAPAPAPQTINVNVNVDGSKDRTPSQAVPGASNDWSNYREPICKMYKDYDMNGNVIGEHKFCS